MALVGCPQNRYRADVEQVAGAQGRTVGASSPLALLRSCAYKTALGFVWLDVMLPSSTCPRPRPGGPAGNGASVATCRGEARATGRRIVLRVDP